MSFDNFLGISKKKRKTSEIGIRPLDLGLSSPKKPKRDTRRSFSQTQRKEIEHQQNNKCARCHEPLDPRTKRFDHKKPWAAGGRTIKVNGRVVCGNCHLIIHHNDNLKKIDKKRKPKKDNTFSLFKI